MADGLERLPERTAFLGGAITGLLVTDPAAPPPRATKDVDVVVGVDSYARYVELQMRLRAIGFAEDLSEGAPLCRWLINGVVVDVMPTNGAILGFSNRWYGEALASAVPHLLPDGTSIRVVSAPHFLATKLDAFEGRGEGDYVASHDIEDIVAVLDGRTTIVDEVASARGELVSDLANRFGHWTRSREVLDAIAAHLPGDPASQGRAPIVAARVRAISELRRL